jgi:hypothetical protein
MKADDVAVSRLGTSVGLSDAVVSAGSDASLVAIVFDKGAA